MVPSDDELDPLDLDTDTDDELVVEDDDADSAAVEAQVEAAQSQLLEAAKKVDVVVLPLACVNEGKGAPIGMGIQRLWAQELSQAGAQAASPVFTAMAEQNGQKVPALMVYRDEWTDERAIEGIQRFPNASRAIITDFRVDENSLDIKLRLVDITRADDKVELSTAESWSATAKGDELPEKIFGLTQEVAAKCGQVIEAKTWQEGFGTSNPQAFLSYLVGVGNLSALQGRCVPASSDQLLSPLMDAINRDAEMDSAMQALHQMVDILLGVQPDRGAVPLCLQALNIAAQKRQKDQTAWHHLAAVARRLGDIPTALQAFNQAFNIDPTHEAVTVHFVQTLRKAEDEENALKVAQFAIERGNEAPSVLALCGSLLIDADEHDTAEPYLRRAIDEGKVPSAYGDRANVLWDRASDDEQATKEDRAEALELLSTAVEQPKIARSTLDMLLDLYEEENLDRARELILKAVAAHPDNAAALSTAANLYLEGDDPDKARPHLQAILKLQRRSLDDDAFARRSILTLDIEEFDERYEAAIEKVHSGDESAQQEAAKFMREIIARDERFWQPHLMLALSVRGSEGDTAALTHLMTASKLRPNDAEIHNLIAAIYRKQGQAKQAVEHLRMVVSLEPRNVEPVVNLAGCLRDANMFDEARSVCDAALKMMPDHPEFKAISESLPPPKDQQN